MPCPKLTKNQKFAAVRQILLGTCLWVRQFGYRKKENGGLTGCELKYFVEQLQSCIFEVLPVQWIGRCKDKSIDCPPVLCQIWTSRDKYNRVWTINNHGQIADRHNPLRYPQVSWQTMGPAAHINHVHVVHQLLWSAQRWRLGMT